MQFSDLISAVQDLDDTLRRRAASAVNVALTGRNWLIGAWIVEFEQNGEDRAKYGDQLISEIARAASVKGLSVSNIRSCRQFYAVYPRISQALSDQFGHDLGVDTSLLAVAQRIHQTVTGEFKNGLATPLEIGDPIRQALSGESEETSQPNAKSELSNLEFTVDPAQILTQLSFSHIIELLKIDGSLKRAFYEIEAIRSGWSVRELKRQIGSLLYQRLGLSRDKEKLMRIVDGKTEVLRPADVIRDPYVFEFIGLRPQDVVEESDLERALLDHLQKFLLELGRGFCLEARQMRIQIGSEYYLIDLVFYHRILKCHVVLDLKLGEFDHGFAGQINTYLNYVCKHLMAEDDNPPVGLLLCTGKDEALVEYALGGMDQQVFVSKYQLQLPDAEEIRAFVRQDYEKLVGPKNDDS